MARLALLLERRDQTLCLDLLHQQAAVAALRMMEPQQPAVLAVAAHLKVGREPQEQQMKDMQVAQVLRQTIMQPVVVVALAKREVLVD